MNMTTCYTVLTVELIRFIESEGYDRLRVTRVVMRPVGPGSVQFDSSDDWDLRGDTFDEHLGAFLEGRLLDGCNGFRQ